MPQNAFALIVQRGHTMVRSDHAAQGEHAYIPQGALGQNRQNTSSDGAGSAEANPEGSDDYGKVDRKA